MNSSHPSSPISNITSFVKPALITNPQAELVSFFLYVFIPLYDNSHFYGTNYMVFIYFGLVFFSPRLHCIFFEHKGCILFSKVSGSQIVNKCLSND